VRGNINLFLLPQFDTVTQDKGPVEDYAYGVQGRRTSEFNALRGMSNRTAIYDADDRLITSGDFAYTYDADGFLTLKTNMTTLEATTYTDDISSGTITVTSPQGRTSQLNYDPLTLLTTSASAPGLLDATYQYDARGRITTSTVGTRNVSYTYDAAGNLDTVSEPVTGAVAYDYDPIGRVTSILQPDNHNVGFEYDLNGNLTALTTPSGEVHSFTYNALGLATSYATPLGNTYTSTYDSDKRLIAITLPSTAQMTYAYSLGRLDSVTEPGGATTTFAYDTAGRLSSITRQAESVTFGYDGSLPTSIAYAGIVNQTIATTYNNDFVPTSVTYAGTATNYAYDNDGLLTQAGSFSITHDAQNGLPTSVSDGTATMTPSYNGYGEVTNATTAVNGVNVAAMSLEYDNAGRISGKTETLGGATSTYAYTYDAMSRLDTVRRNGSLVEDYGYDAQGRRVAEYNSLRGIPSTRASTYDDDDRLVTSGDYAYGFDADGFLNVRTNMTTQETTAYNYARSGQLQSVILRTGLPDQMTIEYVHNAAGQRVAKKVNGVVTEKYLWAGITGLLAVYDGANNLLIRFEGAKMVKNGQTYYLITDQVGSVRAVVDATGNIVKHIAYDSFGNILADTAPAFTIPLGFAGGLHDRDTNLVRFGFRDYDPDSGTWTAKDPILFASAEFDLYCYCGNDPIGHRDRWGLYGLADATADIQALGHWWAYESIVPGPYGNPDPNSWGSWGDTSTWSNIFDGPQRGTAWGTAQKISVGVAVGATAVAVGRMGYLLCKGDEIVVNRNFRINPIGDWDSKNPYGKPPHYHYRPGNPPPPGQSRNRHRPWEPSPFDKSWWDRFGFFS
jgi:RHS repeat-associated protein